MIAVKREVAVFQQWKTGFPWSECQVRKLTTSHCTGEASFFRHNLVEMSSEMSAARQKRRDEE